MKTIVYTCTALVCFAANSVLCRLALGTQAIDPASFTAVRLFSGIVALATIYYVAMRKSAARTPDRLTVGSWLSSVALFIYAITFSYAYVILDTGTGALMLFGSVQVAMIVWQVMSGNRLRLGEWCGVVIAFGGLTYLVYPSLSTPSFLGLGLMTIAGISWAGYTIRGKSADSPLTDTAFNFFRTAPFVFLLLLPTWDSLHLTTIGLLYAVLSGAVASGIGYAVWYVALEKLSATEAAVTQLSVPAIAAIGGLLYIGEAIELRLIIAAALILGGILVVVLARMQSPRTRSSRV